MAHQDDTQMCGLDMHCTLVLSNMLFYDRAKQKKKEKTYFVQQLLMALAQNPNWILLHFHHSGMKLKKRGNS